MAFFREYKLTNSYTCSNIIIVFILAAWIHCFVYISKGLVTRGYIHYVFIIFILESMLLQVVQVVLLLAVLLLVVLVMLFRLSNVCRHFHRVYIKFCVQERSIDLLTSGSYYLI